MSMLSQKKKTVYKTQGAEALNVAQPGEPNTPRSPTPQCVPAAGLGWEHKLPPPPNRRVGGEATNASSHPLPNPVQTGCKHDVTNATRSQVCLKVYGRNKQTPGPMGCCYKDRHQAKVDGSLLWRREKRCPLHSPRAKASWEASRRGIEKELLLEGAGACDEQAPSVRGKRVPLIQAWEPLSGEVAHGGA